MSGGAPPPSAPNLSGNIQNANNAFNTATSNAAQTFNTAQAYNQNAQNTLAQVNGATSPMQQAVNQTSQNNLNSYNNTFMPLQAQQAQQAKDYTSAANINQLQGMAVADQNASLQQQLANQRQQLASEGVDPASVHGSALAQQAAVQGAAANANAANQSYLQTQATGRGLVQQANQLGLQVGQAGNQGAQTGSTIGAQMVGNANQTNATGVNNLTAANTYLNTGVNANQSASNIANTQFQDQLAQQQAQAAQQNSTMGAIGDVTGMALKAAPALMAMAGGGVVPEHVGTMHPGLMHPGMHTPYRHNTAPFAYSGGGVIPGYAGGGAVMPAQTPAVAPFAGGGTLPRQLPNNYEQGGAVLPGHAQAMPPMAAAAPPLGYTPQAAQVAAQGIGNYIQRRGRDVPTYGMHGATLDQLHLINTHGGGAYPAHYDQGGPVQVPNMQGFPAAPAGVGAGNWEQAAPPTMMQRFGQNLGNVVNAVQQPAQPGQQMQQPMQHPMQQYQGNGLGAAVGGFAQGLGAHMDQGGFVSQQGALPQSPIPGSTDTKPAWLTPGEFVIPRDVAAWKGHEYWYKEMDKARQQIAQKHGALPPPSHHTSPGSK